MKIYYEISIDIFIHEKSYDDIYMICIHVPLGTNVM